MQVIIGTTDITKYINESSYSVKSTRKYKDWTDGNQKNHRVFTREQVTGSFDLYLFEGRGMTTEGLVTLINDNSTNGVLTITLYVPNTTEMSTLDAFYTLEVSKHLKLSNGKYIDKVKLSLEEC